VFGSKKKDRGGPVAKLRPARVNAPVPVIQGGQSLSWLRDLPAKRLGRFSSSQKGRGVAPKSTSRKCGTSPICPSKRKAVKHLDSTILNKKEGAAPQGQWSHHGSVMGKKEAGRSAGNSNISTGGIGGVLRPGILTGAEFVVRGSFVRRVWVISRGVWGLTFTV